MTDITADQRILNVSGQWKGSAILVGLWLALIAVTTLASNVAAIL